MHFASQHGSTCPASDMLSCIDGFFLLLGKFSELRQHALPLCIELYKKIFGTFARTEFLPHELPFV
jgi:hypothetical protein